MGARILIVDDDRELRQELRDIFYDYEVAEASSGEEALSMLKRANEIGLMLLDVRMSGLSGIDTLARLKKTDPQLHVIIMTGQGSKDVAIEALKARADDFIEKPIDPEEVMGLVEEALSKLDYGPVEPDAADINAKIKKVESFVKRNCFKKISLTEAARSVSLSSKYLSRIFKEKTKKSFSQFKIGIKIDKAKEILAKHSYNVNQISEKLGYENVESFIRQFKKLTGKSPTAFRKKIWKKR